ncbi:Mitochondrial import inner membrane translocase subunit tim8 [Neodidymelliopsis sp. IMI 364377]|nr:Mitochondrial import inner membrane translocase subunit tim8 [Neodidymelliopsis sp. IMI 364377]
MNFTTFVAVAWLMQLTITLVASRIGATLHPLDQVRALNDLGDSIYSLNPAEVATTVVNEDQRWTDNVARGRKLLAAMKGSDMEAAAAYSMGTTAKSVFDGDLRDEMEKWGWNDNTKKQQKAYDVDCDFLGYHKIGGCFRELGLDKKSKGKGGPNECFVAEHWDGPAVKKTVGIMPKPKNHRYEVCKVKYRSTEGYYRIGINALGGAIMALDRKSPSYAAEDLWGRKPTNDQLPHIRAASDIAWAFWNRATAGGSIKNIKYFFNCLIVNEETQALIRQAHEKMTPPRSAPGMWPGTEFTMNSEQGLALLGKCFKELLFLIMGSDISTGSPLGRWGGFFLIQHEAQLGGSKYISKVRVFKNDAMTMPYMVFYVEDPSSISVFETGDEIDLEELEVKTIDDIESFRAKL